MLEVQPYAAAGLAADNVLQAGGFFGICGFASVDWINCELACQYLGAPFPRMSQLDVCPSLSLCMPCPLRRYMLFGCACFLTCCGINPVRCTDWEQVLHSGKPAAAA